MVLSGFVDCLNEVSENTPDGGSSDVPSLPESLRRVKIHLHWSPTTQEGIIHYKSHGTGLKIYAKLEDNHLAHSYQLLHPRLSRLS